MYGANVETITISKIFEVPISVRFLSEGQISQPLTVTLYEVATQRNLRERKVR
jgi:hypothetical protein